MSPCLIILFVRSPDLSTYQYGTAVTLTASPPKDYRLERFVVHFTPTHSSSLNLIERGFAKITSKRICRGSWASVKELKAAIMDNIRNWNISGRTFV